MADKRLSMGKQIDLDKACEWIAKNAHKYVIQNIGELQYAALHHSIVDDFKREMEHGD